MKTNILKSTALGLLLAAGVALASCKEKEAETTDTTEVTEETIENSTDPEDGDTVVSPTDSITQANRDDKSMSGGEQVP